MAAAMGSHRCCASSVPCCALPRLQVALRKILKKYDKLRGGQRGRNFLQHCWRLPSGGAFLHSPLLDELKAIQVGGQLSHPSAAARSCRGPVPA